MSELGDLVKLVRFVEGKAVEVPALIATLKRDAHGAVIAGLHLLHTDIPDVVEEAAAAKDDAEKVIGMHFSTAPLTTTTTTSTTDTVQPTGPTQAETDAATIADLEAQLAAAQAKQATDEGEGAGTPPVTTPPAGSGIGATTTGNPTQ